MTDMEFREVEIRAVDTELRQVSGLAVPYNEVIEVSGYQERFERGDHAFTDNATLFYGHDHSRGGLPIGKVVSSEDTDDGLVVRAQISKTPKGDEVYQLLKDGVLRKFSVGFKPLEQRMDGDVVVRTRTRFQEVSVVPFPAYQTASIAEVRSEVTHQKEETMEENAVNSADLTEIRETVTDLERRMAVIGEGGSVAAPAPFKFDSMGDFVKRGLAEGLATSDDIDLMVRVYGGDVVADVTPGFVPSWIARDVKLLAQRRNILEVFSKQALPSDGMTVTYPVFGTTTGDVALQAAEGDNLTLIKVTLSNASANVLTYGAYSDLSRQVIERTPTSYLNKVLEAQKLSYAKVTNGAVRTLLTTSPGSYNQVTMPALSSQGAAKAWVDAALAATSAITLNSQALTPDIWIVPAAVFSKIASVYDTTGRPVFVVNGDGANTVGNVNVLGRTANIAGLRVVVDDGLTGTDTFVLSGDAITVLEDGAKFLQDQNIINLTQQFSIYGYMALTKNDVKGISRVIVPAV